MLVVAAALLALSGCATSRSVADGKKISAEQGLLVFQVETRFPWAQLQYRKFSTKNSFGYFFAEEITGPDGAFFNRAGKTYWVKPVKAGEYMWAKLLIDTRYAIFHGSNRFTIKPGTITYVGHLTIEEAHGSARIGVVDGEQDIRDYLAKNYPQYLQTMALEKSITAFEF
jgi:hypothetical protein